MSKKPTLNTINKCYCCGELAPNPIHKGDFFRCRKCGHTIAASKYFDSDFNKLYSEKYFKGEEYLDYVNDREAIQRNFDERIIRLKKLFPNRKQEHVLEIGAAYGFFGDSLRYFFPEVKFIGFEISSEPSEWGRNNLNLDIRNQDYLASQLPNELFSDVFMWDVIEHLPDPVLFLNKAFTEMKEGGHIHITTGDIGRLLPTMQGSKWRMIHPPTHLHYFTRKSLTKLLDLCGFRVVHVSYPTVYRSIRQIWYSLFSLNKKNGTESHQGKLKKSRFIGINTYDIMFVVAEKASTTPHR